MNPHERDSSFGKAVGVLVIPAMFIRVVTGVVTRPKVFANSKIIPNIGVPPRSSINSVDISDEPKLRMACTAIRDIARDVYDTAPAFLLGGHVLF